MFLRHIYTDPCCVNSGGGQISTIDTDIEKEVHFHSITSRCSIVQDMITLRHLKVENERPEK